MKKAGSRFAVVASLLVAVGCHRPADKERLGKTYYLEGAGNWNWGGSTVAEGLQHAGYAGDVEIFLWTTSFNPLIDQLNVVAAKLRSVGLARRIEAYHERYPHARINIVALSAGTGVALWAVEQLENVKVHNVLMFASSLAHDYDASAALANISGAIYVYHSSRDDVLKQVELIGTIDGKRGVPAAGLVGLVKPVGFEERIVNVAWDPHWERFGWRGRHFDCTDPTFVREVIAPHLMSSAPAASYRSAQSYRSTMALPP